MVAQSDDNVKNAQQGAGAMTALQNRISFVVMVVLIFVVGNILGTVSVSTRPHLYLSLPFDWLQLHRHGDSWSIEHFDFRMLSVAVLIAVLVTWVVSKALRHRVAAASDS